MFSVLCTIVVAKLLDYKFYKFMEDIHEFGILEKSLFKSYFFFFDKQAQFIKGAKNPNVYKTYTRQQRPKTNKNQKTNHPSTGGNPLQEI